MKKKTILKFLSLVLSAFAFTGLFALGTSLLSNDSVSNQPVQEAAATHSGDGEYAEINKSTWDTFKSNNSAAIQNVTSFVTSLSAPATQGSVRESIGTSVMADINGSVMTIYSYNAMDDTIRLPADCSDFYFVNTSSYENAFKNVTSMTLTHFNTSSVTNMRGMFGSCYALTTLNLSDFNTSNVTDMSYMFFNDSNLETINISGFDTSKVTNMSYMFASCFALTTLDVGGFNTEKVTNMECMFQGCASLTTLDVSGFDTSEATSMAGMFKGCSSYNFRSLDLSNFNTSKVTNMYQMFQYCAFLTNLDLSNFDTSHVTDMSELFYSCSYLSCVNLSGFDMTNVVYATNMFGSCSALSQIDMPKTLPNDTSITIDLPSTFYLATNLSVSGSTLNAFSSYLSTSSVTNSIVCGNFLSKSLWEDFKTNNSTAIQSVTQIETSVNGSGGTLIGTNVGAKIEGTKLTIYSTDSKAIILPADCSYFFYIKMNYNAVFRYVTTMNIQYFNTSCVTNMSYMFHGCSRLTSLDLSNFNTSNVTDMSYIFFDCQKLTSLDLSSFDTSNVTNMTMMFSCCYDLTSLNLSSFDTSNVTNMSNIFASCQALTSLDLSSFDTSNVESMGCMFFYCYALTSLDLSSFDTSNVESMGLMFFYCNALTSLDLSSFDMTNVLYATEMFHDCYSLTSIYMPKALPNVENVDTIELPGTTSDTIATYGLVSDSYVTRSTNFINFPTSTTGNKEQIIRAQEVEVAKINGSYGTVDVSEIGIFEGDSVTTNENQLFVNDSLVATATPTQVEGYTTTVSWDLTALALNNTVTANFVRTINSHTLTFVLGNGDPDESITQNYGTAVAVPTPTREGYTLTGWSPEAPTTVPDADVTYTAQWTINQYTITYVYGNGTANLVRTYDYNEDTLPEPDDPEMIGYTFNGWDGDTPAKMPANNLTITAQWTINSHTLRFIVDGQDYEFITEDYGIAITPPTDPEKEGYTFAGWNPDVPATMPDEDMDLVAQWAIHNHTITFVFDNGSANQVDSYNYGETITAPTGFEKRGYTFSNWSPSVPSVMGDENLTVTAQWTINTYTITYNLVIEGTTNPNPTSYTVLSDAITLTAPTYYGYNFLGWSEGEGDPQLNVVIPTNSVGNREFTANVELIEYTITKNVDGNDVIEHYTVETPTFNLTNPSKNGYTFVGWTEGEEEPVVTVTIEKGTYGDMIFTAHFAIVNYQITYDLGGGLATDNPTSYTIESDTFTLNNPSKTGYTFLGWTGTDLTHLTETVVIEKGLTGERTYAANYNINQYTITLKDGDVVIATITQNYGTDITVQPAPTKAGYTFTGWSQEIPEVMGAENQTITASFTPIVYTITYNLDGGVTGEENPTEYTVESDTIVLSNPTKEGYIFDGWIENEGDKPTIDYTIEQGSVGDKTLTACWTKIDSKIPIVVGASLAGVTLVGGSIAVGLTIARRRKRLV